MTRTDSERVIGYEPRRQWLLRQLRLLWAVMLTFFPAAFILRLGGSGRWHFIIPLFGAWLCWAVLLTVVDLRLARFPCPPCRKPFFRRDGPRRL